MADLHEAPRQDVLKEAADKRGGIELDGPLSPAPHLVVGEPNRSALEGTDAVGRTAFITVADTMRVVCPSKFRPSAGCVHPRGFRGAFPIVAHARRLPRLVWLLLTSPSLSREGSPQVRARCFPASRPRRESGPHLPARLNRPTSLCGAISSDPVRPYMRFLSVDPPVPPSLPPAGRLPFRRWIRVVVLSHFHVLVLPTGDLHPTYNALMLGAYESLEAPARGAPPPRARA